MKISFTTLGCKLNFAESSALGKMLIARGHTRAEKGEEADICVINTCSVTDAADPTPAPSPTLPTIRTVR